MNVHKGTVTVNTQHYQEVRSASCILYVHSTADREYIHSAWYTVYHNTLEERIPSSTEFAKHFPELSYTVLCRSLDSYANSQTLN